MKVWILTVGEYSNHRVEGVYSTQEKAQAAYDQYAALDSYHNSPNDPVEMEVDEPMDWGLREYWKATINLETGDCHAGVRINVRRGEFSFVVQKWHDSDQLEKQPEWGRRLEQSKYHDNDIAPWQEVRSYVSQEHAFKVASELRQEFLRLQSIGVIVPRAKRRLGFRLLKQETPK